MLQEDSGIEVVGTAHDGRHALEQAASLEPDVVSLDIAMPVMDGLECLGELIRRRRQRTVILSTLAQESSFTTFKALALGAIDFVTKPGSGAFLLSQEELGVQLRDKIRTAVAVPT